MTCFSRERRAGLGLIAGILVFGGLALTGYRIGQDEIMAAGIVGIVLLAIWTFARPTGPADGGNADGHAASNFNDAYGGDGGGAGAGGGE